MPPPLSDEIRAHLRRYLAGEITLRQFDEWFVPATWDVEQRGDQDVLSLTSMIYLRPAEFSNGHWTEEEVRQELAKIATDLAAMTVPH